MCRCSFWTVGRDLKWAKEKLGKYNKEMDEAKEMGDKHIKATEVEIKDYRKAMKIQTAIEHPDEKKPITWFFRMSSFVPMSVPILVGMICTPQTPLNLIFWQWTNQTYNGGLNYSNRNATCPLTNKDLLRSYLISCSSAIAVSLLVRTIANRFVPLNMSKGMGIALNGIVASAASSAAGFLNLLSMRSTEMKKGIKVMNEEKVELEGESNKAAKKAVIQSATTRAILAWPCVFGPALAMWGMDALRLTPKHKVGKTAIDLFICTLGLALALPFSLSFFPPIVKMPVANLEDKFKGLKDINGGDINYVYFNKGL